MIITVEDLHIRQALYELPNLKITKVVPSEFSDGIEINRPGVQLFDVHYEDEQTPYTEAEVSNFVNSLGSRGITTRFTLYHSFDSDTPQ